MDFVFFVFLRRNRYIWRIDKRDGDKTLSAAAGLRVVQSLQYRVGENDIGVKRAALRTSTASAVPFL